MIDNTFMMVRGIMDLITKKRYEEYMNGSANNNNNNNSSEELN